MKRVSPTHLRVPIGWRPAGLVREAVPGCMTVESLADRPAGVWKADGGRNGVGKARHRLRLRCPGGGRPPLSPAADTTHGRTRVARPGP